ncbi:DUF4114 domain-containing protein [Leptolyngbya iicbica]|uniref:DUF4114 domain-containing protein n=2 Tax=Cyanophyceae TaxID=3028117 RepID=A0A4Q7E900_9CYAN|nr:DUF4114 domain-containing protein [Leptolyngbya sp. LK]RZM77331.1 DUF4114 domain-containing protein [Leptolyngbya sp. LK]
MKIGIVKPFAVAATLVISGLMAAEAQAFSFTQTEATNLEVQNKALFDFFKSHVNTERAALSASELKPLDATGLLFDTSETVEVYFMYEGAGYKNEVLFTADNQAPKTLIANASLQGSGGTLKSGDGWILSDFSGLPGIAQFEFLIRSNGYNKPNNTLLYTDASKNSDGLEHVTAFGYTDEKTGEYYTFIGFEDIVGGGDLDYNDVVLVAKGFTNPDAPVDVPEPISGLAVLAVGAVAVGGALKKKMA